MFVIRLNFRNVQSLCLRFLKRLYFPVVKCFVRKLIWQSNIRNFDILKCLLIDSTFEMFNRLLASWNAYISRLLQCLIESWFDYQISEILSIWNVCYKAQVWSCSIAFLRPETLIFPCSKMFCEKLIWLSNIRNFDILKWLLYDNFRNVQSFANFLKSKCLLENWFDHKISEILTFWNVCYMTQLSKYSIVC